MFQHFVKMLLTGRIVRPPENGTEDRPAIIGAGVIGVTAVKVPYISFDGIRAWPVAPGIVALNTQKLGVGVPFKGTNTLTE